MHLQKWQSIIYTRGCLVLIGRYRVPVECSCNNQMIYHGKSSGSDLDSHIVVATLFIALVRRGRNYRDVRLVSLGLRSFAFYLKQQSASGLRS